MKLHQTLGAALAALLIAGCSSAPPPDDSVAATNFLKWSMNQYAALKSFKATVKWSMSGQDLKETRTIFVQAPSKFRVATLMSSKEKMTTICDGDKLIEVAQGPQSAGTLYPAPQNVSTAENLMMRHPVFNGSPIYQFFGGSDNFYELVDTDKGKVEFGPKTTLPGGEVAQTVSFQSSGGYGLVQAMIGTKSGFVYGLQYDGLPTMLKDTPQMRQYGDKLPQIETIEAYSDIQANVPSSKVDFLVSAPSGIKIDKIGPAEPTPPVPLNSPAPAFTFTTVGGKKFDSKALKGQVVMLDFWATWCGPCRESLPITDAVAAKYAGKGLQVLAVSNEDKDKVADFVKTNNYNFDACLDVDSTVAKAYHVDGIPCVAIIDANGNLSSYTVGFRPESDLLARLKKAGLKD